MIKKQFTLYLENKPGELAAATQALAAADINLEGISVMASPDVGLVQIVVDDAAKTKRLLKKALIPFTVQDVVVAVIANKPGSLSAVVSKLAQKKINLNYVYATACTCKDSKGCYAIVSAPDLKKVDMACRSGKC